jgi:hypothetical protein
MLAALRNELGADYVLQGSVRLNGDVVRLALQLVETATDKVVWAERFDRPYADILAVRSDILEQIVGRLAREAQDAGGILASSPATSDLAVYELVLRARRAYFQFERQAAFEGYNLAIIYLANTVGTCYL